MMMNDNNSDLCDESSLSLISILNHLENTLDARIDVLNDMNSRYLDILHYLKKCVRDENNDNNKDNDNDNDNEDDKEAIHDDSSTIKQNIQRHDNNDNDNETSIDMTDKPTPLESILSMARQLRDKGDKDRGSGVKNSKQGSQQLENQYKQESKRKEKTIKSYRNTR